MSAPDPFVGIDDLKDAGVDIGPAAEARAAFLAEYASSLIRAECKGDPDPTAARLVCIAMVRRALGAAEDGATQQSQTVGPFTQSMSFSSPYGLMALTKAERRMLGIAQARTATVSMTGDDSEEA